MTVQVFHNLYAIGNGFIWLLEDATSMLPGVAPPLLKLCVMAEDTLSFAVALFDNNAIYITGGMREVYYGEDSTEEISDKAWLFDLESRETLEIAPMR